MKPPTTHKPAPWQVLPHGFSTALGAEVLLDVIQRFNKLGVRPRAWDIVGRILCQGSKDGYARLYAILHALPEAVVQSRDSGARFNERPVYEFWVDQTPADDLRRAKPWNEIDW